jgi:hypothetical protein
MQYQKKGNELVVGELAIVATLLHHVRIAQHVHPVLVVELRDHFSVRGEHIVPPLLSPDFVAIISGSTLEMVSRPAVTSVWV